MTTLVWFKRDLRTIDHAPLAHAIELGSVIALYIYEPIIIDAPIFDASHLEFLNQCLIGLADDLAALGIPLRLWRGEATEVLAILKKQAAFDILASHEETGNAATYDRDKAVKVWCNTNCVTWREWAQHGVVRRLKSRNGWAKRWNQRMSSAQIDAPQVMLPSPQLTSIGIQDADALGLPACAKRIQRGGREAGLRLLESFLDSRSHHYQREMSSPEKAWTSCSRLSTHFSFGTVSLREATQRCAVKQVELRERLSIGEPIPSSWQRSLQSFQARLHWHCHFMQKLEDEPAIEFENFSRSFDGMRPLVNEPAFNHELYAAWCEGRTGYPMVDACMRALLETGWINFRMRAMLMSFASYQLWLDWRPVAQHLAKHFLDFEAGIHYSQCQMQSGTTGINTPRMYSPIKQAIENDSDGVFIKRFLPALVNIPTTLLAEPHRLNDAEQKQFGCVIGQDYPQPIVEYKTSTAQARERYAAYRNAPSAKTDADQVQQRHGSRKSGVKQMNARKVRKESAKEANVESAAQLNLPGL
jgi:deoxyribodipyrimidine photo-lyase